MTVPSRPPAAVWAMLIALGMIWGAAFMSTRVATGAFGPFTIAAGRLTIGAATLMIYLRLSGERLPGPGARRFWLFAFMVAFLANAMPFTALGWAQRHIDSALAGVFMAAVPLFVLPLGHLFVPGERMTLRRLAGFAVGFGGVMVLIGPEVLAGFGAGGSLALLAQGACLLAALGYAAGGVVAKRAPQLELIRFAAATLMIAAVQVAPFALILEAPFGAVPEAGPVLALVYLGLLPTALAMVLLLAVIDRAGPGFLSLVNYQVPVWAIVFGAAFLGETVPGRIWLGLGLILAGLAVSQNLRALRRGGVARG